MKIEYQIKRSSRRTLAIHITSEGAVEVRCPMTMPKTTVESFVESKRGWIEKNLQALSAKPKEPKLTEAERQTLARQAGEVFLERAAYYAPLVGVSFGRITIRCQRSRWGSCSSKGNLNFNYLLMLSPPEVLDYVVVHELCHRKEMNHSPRFWAEVERVMPDYRVHKQWLKDHGSQLMGR